MKQNQLAKQQQPAIVTIDGQRYRVVVANQQAQPNQIIQQADSRPAQYQTLQSQGIKQQPIKLPKLPSVLSLSLAAVVAISFLVAASMFSISLTAYSNAVDRTDQNRSFINVR
ncbi:MAG: hypothetical protein WBA41_31265 [Rivularia sp. (in: cyanobacteria)]